MTDSDSSGVVVVTGANSGIGKSVSRQLAEQDHHVVMVCRNADKGQAAADEIRRATPNGTLAVVQGDLSTIAGTRNVAERLLDLYPEIHVLINNAGVWMSRRVLNDDGLEMTFMVNHVAPFLLTNLIGERLKSAPAARIVMVNAGLYAAGEIDLDQLPTGKNFHRFKTYMHSKLLNIYATMEFARRLEGTGITVNAVHPGVIRTNLGNSRGPLGLLLRAIKLFWKSPQNGAKPVVNLAVNPELATVTGKYFNELEPEELAPNARDASVQQAVWTTTEKLIRDAFRDRPKAV